MKFITAGQRDEAKRAEFRGLAKHLRDAIADAGIFEKPVRIVSRYHRSVNDDDGVDHWWTVDAIEWKGLFRKRMGLVYISYRNTTTVYGAGELGELVERESAKYYGALREAS